MRSNNTHDTHSEEETLALAAALALSLCEGDVLLLEGGLGAGKTVFTRGLLLGLGGDGEQVSSPTFALMHEYTGGRLTLTHFDLYRLSGLDEVLDLGFDEVLTAGRGVCCVEWPSRAEGLWEALPVKRVTLEALEGEGRRITLEGFHALSGF